MKSIHRIEPLANGRLRDRAALLSETRWSRLARPPRKAPAGYVELGELCRVHRGQVTGANRIWIAGRHSTGLPPSVLFRSVTRARELFDAHGVLADENTLRMVIDLPIDLTGFSGSEKRAIDRFLSLAKTEGAANGYVASNRKAWWSVGLKSAAPILATCMARRPPAFVRNLVGARHINIAHGLYPRDPLAPQILDRLAAWLSKGTQVAHGRTYAGGLTKFEPREMERLLVPSPESEAVLSPGRLRKDSAMARRVIEVVRLGLDRRRFPWILENRILENRILENRILENREPSEHERAAAVLASAALMATRKVRTARRSEGKETQELLVESTLSAAGLTRVDPRTIPTLNHASNPGEFCRESLLGSRKADIVLRLRDHRLVPIECKVSNSALNSVKRVNNDAAVKAEVWLKDFGTRNIVPAAVLSGVYKLRHLLEAQNRGLTLFWAHDFQRLVTWVNR